mgnify:CR=1 FL=1
MNEQTTRVGLDVGFGDVKLVYLAEGLHTLTFPAILGRAEDPARGRQLDLGLGGRRRRIQTLEYGGNAYFVGEGALTESRLAGSQQNAGRIGSEEERLLMLAALARAIDDALARGDAALLAALLDLSVRGDLELLRRIFALDGRLAPAPRTEPPAARQEAPDFVWQP